MQNVIGNLIEQIEEMKLIQEVKENEKNSKVIQLIKKSKKATGKTPKTYLVTYRYFKGIKRALIVSPFSPELSDIQDAIQFHGLIEPMFICSFKNNKAAQAFTGLAEIYAVQRGWDFQKEDEK